MIADLPDELDLLFRQQRSPRAATFQFRRWKHNDDILPKLQLQLETALEAMKKFEPVVYDTQGPRDDGADIVIRCQSANQFEHEPELIGFQIKSFDDLTKADYMKELKAQRDDSFRKVNGLTYYFILLCTDLKKHQQIVRNVSAEFRSAERTKVIDPTWMYTFLNQSKTSIEAFVKRRMQGDDIVFRRALWSLSQTSPSARALTVFLVVKSVLTGKRKFSQPELVDDAILRSAYEMLRKRQEALLEAAVEERDLIELELGRANAVDSDEDEESEEPEEPVQIADFEDQIAQDIEHLETDLLDVVAGSNELC